MPGATPNTAVIGWGPLTWLANYLRRSLLDLLSNIIYKYREIKEWVTNTKFLQCIREEDRDEATGTNDPVLAMLELAGSYGSKSRETAL